MEARTDLQLLQTISEISFIWRPERLAGMLRPRGPCGLQAKSFGLSLTLSGLGLDLGLMASGLGLVASNIYSAHDIN